MDHREAAAVVAARAVQRTADSCRLGPEELVAGERLEELPDDAIGIVALGL
jgi:hypothetical protein